ncbi:hypothetical protein HUT19_41560 (plasmid) [Streptomyces sp. NA02950]|uniref:hypothetical protein n=1 Tax=Streptomyces sp. NA02950 TaxID=2742137 RepID=UPI001591994A|nr:hypothetical protein [Streptomyces sp. NA02950]QKV98212.1 hypothetical protein HUT19_41560 [Streptomyces sp. NA02950]
MDWLIAAAQQPSTSTSPVWLAPLLGGVGAVLGGSLTSMVAWRVLSDTKQARKRAEEKEAAATITAALLEVRQIYRNTDVGSGPAPEDFEYWSDYLLSKLGKAEVAVMAFRSEALRTRLTASLDLLIWGSHDARLLYETRLGSSRAVAYAAHQDAMACLGATLRGEKLPEATKAWKEADGHMQWMAEEERRATEEE